MRQLSLFKDEDMADLVSKIEEIIKTIPFGDIRTQTYEALKKDGMLQGNNEDIEYLIMEQVDNFQFNHSKRIRQAVWDATFRQVRKILGCKIKEWYNERLAGEFTSSMQRAMNNAALPPEQDPSKSMEKMVEDMTEELIDIGGEA